MQSFDTIVIGGGITGLCAGWYARAAGDSVCVLEAAERPGGWAHTLHEDGFQFDWGPNGFLDREPMMLEWVEALGLTGELVQADESAARRFILRHGKLVEIVPPPRFLAKPLLSVPGRARLMMEPLIGRRTDPTPESIHAFASRRIGREAADVLVASMVSGVFGGDAKQLSLAHCFPRMAAMEAEHGSLFRAMIAKAKEARRNGTKSGSAMGPGGTLTTFRRGIGQLIETAAESLGDSLRLGAGVLHVSKEGAKEGSGFRVECTGGPAIVSKRLVIATPPNATATLLAELAPEAAARLREMECVNMSVVCTAYPRTAVGHGMNGFGFLVPRIEGRRVLGCLWTSSIFPHQAPADWVLLRTMIGGAMDPGAVDLTDAKLIALVEKEVHPLLDIHAAPGRVRIFKHRDSIPQYGLGHQALLDAVDAAAAAHPGLRFAGNAYRGVSLNDCVVSARAAVA